MFRNKKIQISLGLALFFITNIANADEIHACDLEHGKAVFQKCAVCHSVDADKGHGAGPNLAGVINRPVGKVKGFKFSKRMRESDKQWDHEHLNAFLENPQQIYKRNRMAFGGLKDPNDRKAVICFLAQ